MEDNFMTDKASLRFLEALSVCLSQVRAEASLHSTMAKGIK
jgi:hypothetical protein